MIKRHAAGPEQHNHQQPAPIRSSSGASTCPAPHPAAPAQRDEEIQPPARPAATACGAAAGTGCAPGSRCRATGPHRRHRTVEKGVRWRSTSVTSEPISTILPRNQLSGMKPATVAENWLNGLGSGSVSVGAGRPRQTIGTCTAGVCDADAGRHGPRHARHIMAIRHCRRDRQSARCRTGRWAGWPGRAAGTAPWRLRKLSAPAPPRSANRRYS